MKISAIEMGDISFVWRHGGIQGAKRGDPSIVARVEGIQEEAGRGKGNKYIDEGFEKEDMSIAETKQQRVDHGILRRSSLGRCIEYRHVGEEIYGKNRYSELIDPPIDPDLGASADLVDMNKRICARGTPKKMRHPQVPMGGAGFLRRKESK